MAGFTSTLDLVKSTSATWSASDSGISNCMSLGDPRTVVARRTLWHVHRAVAPDRLIYEMPSVQRCFSVNEIGHGERSVTLETCSSTASTARAWLGVALYDTMVILDENRRSQLQTLLCVFWRSTALSDQLMAEEVCA